MQNFLSLAKFFLVFVIFLFLSTEILAFSPEPHLPDPAQEQRAMNLFLEVKCLVCSGQAIESSNTEFSFEMRKLIRQKILQNKSDNEIKKELVQEFGEEILLSNQNKWLWIMPAIIAVIGLALIFRK